MNVLTPWLKPLVSADRSKGIGGTDIAAIVGLSYWATPFDVWLDKKGNTPKAQQEEWQKWGNKLEPFIASAYVEESQKKIVKCGMALANPERSWQVGSPDYLCLDDPKGVDCKNIRLKSSEWGEQWSDQIPMHYVIQAQWYMMLTGADSWEFPVLFGGSQFEIFRVDNNERLASSLLEKAEEFWQTYIIGDKQPEIEDSPKVREWIKSKFPKHSRPLRKANSSEIEIAKQLAQVKKVVASVEKEQSDLEAKIKIAIGEEEGLEMEEGKVTWKANRDGEKTDWETISMVLGAHLPDLYKEQILKHTKPTQGARVLRVSIKE